MAAHILIPALGLGLAIFNYDPDSSFALAFWNAIGWFGFAHLLPGFLAFVIEESAKSSPTPESSGKSQAAVKSAVRQKPQRQSEEARGSEAGEGRLATGVLG
jgi:hypothetical protein